ncbi:OLC1v1014531C1 [Oldenlandia corymbosa var. corymbosa]|uniref:OLC1v1014531C1 n=1 Tax=Oldenlandia corymbosa var. corymbosa TaxID=529605 RepID=A0AAV1E190_OLDCO|nr:OLC1v1014531C1 [Oldenlandia corymbosa var. corymbosa]
MKAFFSNIVFKETIILCLFQHYLLMVFGRTLLPVQNHRFPFRHSLETDKAALLAFKRVISDPHSILANWNESTYVCHFTGVKCDKRNLHRVVVLNLNDSGLVGILSPLISNLTQLRRLELVNNHFSGFIPSEFSFLRHLRDLKLDGNNLSGPIPDSFSHLANLILLINLDVEYNQLSGELPAAIVSRLTYVLYLHLSNNNMTSHDGNTNLEPFFTALSNCTQLQELELGGMSLGGSLPPSIGGISTSLGVMLLQENQIHGSLPPEMGHLYNLELLNLTFNHFNGTFPDEIGQASGLQQLSASYNSFSGEIPATLGKLSGLGQLDLSNNKFSGKIPETLGDLEQLRMLLLNNNLLWGQIPRSLGKCKSMDTLDLAHNNLTGSIPREILGMHEMRGYLNLSHNQLEGNLPIELSSLDKVQEIDLSSNSLNGTIFPQISDCIALQTINFSNNHLQGPLPDKLGDLLYLEVLDVSQNELSGTIPTSLNKIQTLTFMNFSSNKFHGPIPTGGIFDVATSLSFLGNPDLCGNIPGNGGGTENMGNSITANMLCGSIGYIPPDDLSLPKYVKQQYHRQIEKIVDASLMRAMKVETPEVKKMWEVAIGELIELGILCTQDSPSARPTMLDAADDLDRLKKYLNGDTTATFASSLGISSSTISSD